ncbi:MAG: hypothetical protein PWQ31_607 [Eubacteriales bacterium]|nr:hypothetical protein [Eubacteriales bacterium]
MKIIYCCYSGVHTSLIAAALHSGELSDATLSWSALASLPFFNRPGPELLGCPLFVGKSSEGHEVYSLGLGFDRELMQRAMESFLKVWRISEREVFVVDATRVVNHLTRAGTFLTTVCGWQLPGGLLFWAGLRQSWPALARLVAETREKARQLTLSTGKGRVIPFPGRKAFL